MAKKRKKGFKSLPNRSKKAAFAKMTASGTIRPKNKQGRRSGASKGLGLSFGKRRQILDVVNSSLSSTDFSKTVEALQMSKDKKVTKFGIAAAKKITKRQQLAAAKKGLFVGQSALSGSDRTALKRGARGSSWRN